MIQIQRKVVFSEFTQPLSPTLTPPPCIHHVINSCSFVSLQVRKIGRSVAQAHFRLWRNKCDHHQLVGRGGWMDTFATVYIIYMRKTLRRKACILRSHLKRNDTRCEKFWIKMYKILLLKNNLFTE